MKAARLIMGMPAVVEVVGAGGGVLEDIFGYFAAVDERFSTYKPASEISKINRGELAQEEYGPHMREVLRLAEETRVASRGFFDIRTPEGTLDPSGLVKGWAINNAADLLRKSGQRDFWVEVGGDIQTSGVNAEGRQWSVGIRNPFNAKETVKVVYPRGRGIATSGSYIRGAHIYDPHRRRPVASDIASLTVIGPDIYEADRFATAAFAMGREGILFIEEMPDLEGYAIDAKGRATMTSGFSEFSDA